jgi:hypothetical protein
MFYSLLAGTYCFAAGVKFYCDYNNALRNNTTISHHKDVSAVEIRKDHRNILTKLESQSTPVSIVGGSHLVSTRWITTQGESEKLSSSYRLSGDLPVSVPFMVAEHRFSNAYMSNNIISACRKTVAFQHALSNRLPISLTMFFGVFVPISLLELGMYQCASDDFSAMIGLID